MLNRVHPLGALAALALAVAASPAAHAHAHHADPSPPAAVQKDYAAVLEGFDRAVEANLYDPRLLTTPGYRAFRTEFGRRALRARSDQDVIAAFKASWRKDLFSHFDLRLSRTGAAQTTAALRDAGQGQVNAAMSYPAEGVGLLTIHTFMGDEVGRQIMAALAEARQRQVSSLIVDVRDNPGGSMAGVLLVQGLLRQPETIGAFINRRWWTDHGEAPTGPEILAMTPLARPDPKAFADDIAADGVSAVKLSPGGEPPAFRVFLLTSGKTASVAELVAAALKGAGAATLVGETTAGEMLSGEFVDAAPGFQIFMPTSDYYSRTEGRIEGNGVRPHVAVRADKALAAALKLALAAN